MGGKGVSDAVEVRQIGVLLQCLIESLRKGGCQTACYSLLKSRKKH